MDSPKAPEWLERLLDDFFEIAWNVDDINLAYEAQHRLAAQINQRFEAALLAQDVHSPIKEQARRAVGTTNRARRRGSNGVN